MPPTRPPGLLRLLARALLPGREGRLLRRELAESWVGDGRRGLGRAAATARYARNLAGSAWSLAADRASRLVTHGVGLDLRLGVRMLGKQPVLTLVAMLALGLGIPATLSLQHGVNVILSPLPVPEGERVLGIRHVNRRTGRHTATTVHDLERWAEGLESFDAVGAFRTSLVNLDAGRGDPAPSAAEVTASTFDILRTPPLLGRPLVADDEIPDAPHVVVLGEDVWAARYARDPGVVGRVVRIGRTEHTVVGVMPAGFRFPRDESLWLPLRVRPADHAPGSGPSLRAFGRLAEGTGREQAEAEVQAFAARAAEDLPEVYDGHTGQVVPMSILIIGDEDFSRNNGEIRLAQALLLAGLLILCGNVGVLVLARAAGRMGEISIRTALGAGRARIVGQFFLEALVLAGVATGLGLVAAQGIARWIMGYAQPIGLPYWMDLGLDAGIVLTALGLAVACAAVASIVPALRATGANIRGNLQRSGTGATMRFGAGSTLLIVTEIVLSVAYLAVGATVALNLLPDASRELGLDPERYVAGWVRSSHWQADGGGRTRAEARAGTAAFQRSVADRLARLPGVRGVGMGIDLPGGIDGAGMRLVVEGTDLPSADPVVVRAARVGVDFLRDLGRPVLQGRDFASEDGEVDVDAGATLPVIVNTGFVDRVLGGRQPIGRTLRSARSGVPDSGQARYRIVGVVGPFGTNVLNPASDAAVYAPLSPGAADPIGYLVEVAGDPTEAARAFRAAVAAVDPEATALDVMPVAERMRAEGRFLWGIFMLQVGMAAVTFLLSISGLYALMSFTVAQRTREIGIRTALGARPLTLVGTIARRAALQLGAGLVLGAGLAWPLLEAMSADPTLGNLPIPTAVSLTVAATALIGVAACARPTLRGLRIQPTEALREM